MTGDFNVDYSKPIPNNSPNYFQHILTWYNLVNYVTSPTRVTASSAPLIDLFLSTCPIDGTCETVYVDISDHYAVLSHLIFGVAQRTAPTCKPTPLYRVNWDNFSTNLQNQQPSFPDDDSIDGMVNHYTTSSLSTLEKHAPLVYQRKRQRRPCSWLTEELVFAVRRRNKLRRLLAKQTADPTVREQHRIARLTARKLDRKLRNQYFSNQCRTNDQRKLWRVLNTVTGR